MKTCNGRAFVYGFPGLCGGARTEMHHQIIMWLAMGKEVHIICDHVFYKKEPLYLEMLKRGVKIHGKNKWDALKPGDPVFAFGNDSFLSNIKQIRKRTKRTVFVNCMRWGSPQEEECMKNGFISMFLYQNEDVLNENKPRLKALNNDPDIKFLTFRPYFDFPSFPFIDQRSDKYFGCGRISRQHPGKFSASIMDIYERFDSPLPKKGLFLGYGDNIEEKTGPPPPWIDTAKGPFDISQQQFYKHCDIILQPSDAKENWPRIGFEAMASGSVLIVDNKGGWKQMIEHGKTGWLCDTPQNFIDYASQMACTPGLRHKIALAAKEKAIELGGMTTSRNSWEHVFTQLNEQSS